VSPPSFDPLSNQEFWFSWSVYLMHFGSLLGFLLQNRRPSSSLRTRTLPASTM
jgi:hypothetical protein